MKKSSNITWQWLSGFIQAEGTIGRTTDNFLFIVVQRDREPLDLIKNFLQEQYPHTNFPNVHGPYNVGVINHFPNQRTCVNKGIYSFTITTNKHLNILRHLTPYLREDKYVRATLMCKKYGITSPKQSPLTIKWITGFWEGDGWCHLQAGGIQIGFAQKTLDTLEEIHNYYKWGNLTRNTSNKPCHVLTLSHGYKKDARQTYVRVLLKNTCTTLRRTQLEITLSAYKIFQKRAK